MLFNTKEWTDLNTRRFTLVDKMFAIGLSSDERAELDTICHSMDVIEEGYYRPLITLQERLVVDFGRQMDDIMSRLKDVAILFPVPTH